MKKLLWGLALITLMLVSLNGCARPFELSPAVSREYNFSNFARVDFAFTHDFLVIGHSFDVPVEMNVVKSEAFSVDLLANENIFEYIRLSQTGDTLQIRINRNRLATNEATIKFNIGLPELKEIKLSSGIMRADVDSTGSDFEAVVSGAAKLNLNLKCARAGFQVSSSSDVIVNGEALDLKASVSGASNFKSDLKSPSTTIVASGSSDVVIRGEVKEFSAEASGGSTIDLDVKATQSAVTAVSSSDVRGNLTSETLLIEASGASRVELRGSALKASIKGVSSSEILLGDCPLQTASIMLSGASEGQLEVSGSIDIDLSSSSELTYRGEPVLGDIKVTGGSNISHR